MYKINDGKILKFSSKLGMFLVVAVIPSHIKESEALDWHEEQLIKRQK